MKKTLNLLVALTLMFVAAPIQAVSANTVGDKVSGTLSQSWGDKGAGVASIKLTLDGAPVGGLDADRVLVGSPMSEVNSVSHNYSFTAVKPGTYVVTMIFEQMASEATGGKLWTTMPASVSKTHIVKNQEAVITTETKVVDTVVRKFTTSQIKSNTMYEGETKVSQAGVDGLIEKTEIITYSNGTEISRKAGPDRIKREMLPEVIAIGTKVKETSKPDKPIDKPIIKDPEPKPEVDRPIDKKPVDKPADKPADEVVKEDIDFTSIVNGVIFKTEELGLEITEAFNGKQDKYTVEVPFDIKTVNMYVDYKDLSSGNVVVDYPKTINLDDTNKAVIQITQQGKFKGSYEFTFVVEGSVIREYDVPVKGIKLYLTKDLDLNNLEIMELKYLDLEQNELGYYELESGYLALLKQDLSEDTTLPSEWWIMVDDQPVEAVQPALIAGDLYLFSTYKLTHDQLDEDFGINQDLSLKFYEYFLTVDSVDFLPVYGYTTEDSNYIIPVLGKDNEKFFVEVDTDRDTVTPVVIQEREVKTINKTYLYVGIGLVVLLAGSFGVLKFIEEKNNKERIQRYEENQKRREEGGVYK